MRIFPRLFHKANPVWASILRNIGFSDAIWTGKDYRALSQAGYENCMMAYGCVSLIAKTASRIDWTLSRKGLKGDLIAETDNHAALVLLRKPNEYQGRSTYTEAVMAFLLLAGNSYIMRVGIKNEPPKFLYSLRPDRVTALKGDANKLICGYRYEIGGDKTDYVNGEILHLKEFHPTDDFYGLSRISVAARAVDISNTLMEWNKKLLQNDMRPPGAFIAKLRLDDNQFDRLNKQIKEEYQGYNNAAEPLLLDGDLDWKQYAISPKDADWLNGDKANTRKICAVFGVASELLGDSENKTYSNIQEARKALYQETVLPLMDLLRDEYNSWLIPAFGDGLFLDYDRDKIEAIQEDRAKKYTYISQADWLTVNEKREATGYEALEGGDVVLVPLGKVPLIEIGGEGGETGTKALKPITKGYWQMPGRKNLLWKNFSDRVKAKEMPFLAELNKYLKAQGRAITAKITDLTRIQDANLKEIFDEEREAKEYKQKFLPRYSWLFKHAGEAGLRATKGELYMPEEGKAGNFRFGEELEAELEDMILNSGTKINKTTLEEIINILKRADAEDWTVEKTAQEIGANFDELSMTRARLIARTEAAKVENWGQVEGYKQAEFVERKGWLCSFVKDSREAHMAADREYSENTIPLDQAFVVDGQELMFPGDPVGDPGNVCNCLCSTFPDVGRD